MKLCKGIVLILLFVMLTATATHSEIADKIIAVVNDEIITLKEFDAVL